MSHHPLVIAGAGPAGLSLACALAGTGINLAIVDPNTADALTHAHDDGREIALTHLSIHLLQQLGVWDHIEPEAIAPLNGAIVQNGNSPFILDFQAQKADKLGVLISNYALRRALFQRAKQLDNIDWHLNDSVANTHSNGRARLVELASGTTIGTDLLAIADSRYSKTRQQVGIATDMLDFGRTVIVARLQHEQEHDGIARECFFYGNTLAILPLNGKQCSAVFTLPTEKADELMSLPEDEFALLVAAQLQYQLGDMRLISRRHRYPLMATHAKRFVAPQAALIGDAAVGMHPVTAHGYNLGLASADLLAKQLSAAQQRGRVLGSQRTLLPYQVAHMTTTLPTFHGTNALVTLFNNETPLMKPLRHGALRLSQYCPPVKTLITNKLTNLNHGFGNPFRLPKPNISQAMDRFTKGNL